MVSRLYSALVFVSRGHGFLEHQDDFFRRCGSNRWNVSRKNGQSFRLSCSTGLRLEAEGNSRQRDATVTGYPGETKLPREIKRAAYYAYREINGCASWQGVRSFYRGGRITGANAVKSAVRRRNELRAAMKAGSITDTGRVCPLFRAGNKRQLGQPSLD